MAEVITLAIINILYNAYHSYLSLLFHPYQYYSRRLFTRVELFLDIYFRLFHVHTICNFPQRFTSYCERYQASQHLT